MIKAGLLVRYRSRFALQDSRAVDQLSYGILIRRVNHHNFCLSGDVKFNDVKFTRLLTVSKEFSDQTKFLARCAEFSYLSQ